METIHVREWVTGVARLKDGDYTCERVGYGCSAVEGLRLYMSCFNPLALFLTFRFSICKFSLHFYDSGASRNAFL